MDSRIVGTILAIAIVIAAGWAMRRAGNVLRETLKDNQK